MYPPSGSRPSTSRQPNTRLSNGCGRPKLFVFLRHHRYALFSAIFQAELAILYQNVLKASRQSRLLN